MAFYYTCPNCSNDHMFYKVEEDDDGLGCLLLTFGGILPALLYSSSVSGRVQCGDCGFIFRPPGLPASKLSYVFTALIVFVFLALVFSVLGSGLERMIKGPPWTQPIADHVAAHPYVVLYAGVSLCVLVILLAVAGIIGANRVYRKQFTSKYWIEPLSRD